MGGAVFGSSILTLPGIVKSAGVAALLTIVAFSLAGCGRRSDLENPATPATRTATSPAGNTGGQTKPNTKPVAPKQDFLLDPVL
jgi:predicted small lipoprotein YifL